MRRPTTVRVAIALLSAAVATCGLTISGLHSGGVSANFGFSSNAAAGLVIAVVAILNGNFAGRRTVRFTMFAITVAIAGWAGGNSAPTRLAVAAFMIAISLGLPPLWRWARAEIASRFSRPALPATAALALVALSSGALSTGVSGAEIPTLQVSDRCDAAGLAITSNGESVDLNQQRIDIELPGDGIVFTFTATSERPARVGVWFDAFEPVSFAGDVLAWGGVVEPDRPGIYRAALWRTGALGTYELSFRDRAGQIDRSAIQIVPGQTRMRAEFAFLDRQGGVCTIEVAIRLLTEPHTTLLGIFGLAFIAGATTSVSPTRRFSAGAAPADVNLHRPPEPSIDLRTSDLLPPEFDTVTTTIGHVTTTTDAPTVITAGTTEPFSITLRAKIDADDEKTKALRQSEVRLVSLGQALRLITFSPSIETNFGGIEVTVSGKVQATDQSGRARLTVIVECGPEKTEVSRDIDIVEPGVIHPSPPPGKTDPASAASASRETNNA